MARKKLKIRVKKGALHRQLGVKQGTKISAFKLAQAKHSKDALTRKRATFAINASHWNHSGRKK